MTKYGDRRFEMSWYEREKVILGLVGFGFVVGGLVLAAGVATILWFLP